MKKLYIIKSITFFIPLITNNKSFNNSLWRVTAVVIMRNYSPLSTLRDAINFTGRRLFAISLNVTEARGEVLSVLWETVRPRGRKPRTEAASFFFFPSLLLNGNGELRLRFMDGVTLRRLWNFDFMAVRLIAHHRQWTAKCTATAVVVAIEYHKERDVNQ